MRKTILVVAVFALVSTLAHSEVYVGASAGRSTFKDSVSNVDFDQSALGWKIFGGFRPFRFIGLEASYLDLGSPDDDSSGVSWAADAKAWDAFAVGVLPLGPVRLFGKAGFLRGDLRRTVNGESDGDTILDPAYGAGIAVRLGKHFAIRAEYERFDISDLDQLSLWSAGAEFRF